MSNFTLDFNVGEGIVKLDAKIIPFIKELNIQLTFGSNCPDLTNTPNLSQFINLEKLTYKISYMNYIIDASDSKRYFWIENPCDLINQRINLKINVKWNKEHIYSGIVISYDPSKQTHNVLYDDGRFKTYDMTKKTFCLQRSPSEWFESGSNVKRYGHNKKCVSDNDYSYLSRHSCICNMSDNPLITSVLNKEIVLDLTKCTKLQNITLINVGKHTIDNLDLTKCVHLKGIHFSNNILNTINEKYDYLQYVNLSKLDLTKCAHLKEVNYCVFVNTTIYNEITYNKLLPNLSNNIKISLPIIKIIELKKGGHTSGSIFSNRWISHDSNDECTQEMSIKPFVIEDNHEIFPRNLTEFSREGVRRLRRRVKQLEEDRESIISLIESKFNKLEEENKELRKIIDELRPIKSSYM
jgi:hypothetical protein